VPQEIRHPPRPLKVIQAEAELKQLGAVLLAAAVLVVLVRMVVVMATKQEKSAVTAARVPNGLLVLEPTTLVAAVE